MALVLTLTLQHGLSLRADALVKITSITRADIVTAIENGCPVCRLKLLVVYYLSTSATSVCFFIHNPFPLVFTAQTISVFMAPPATDGAGNVRVVRRKLLPYVCVKLHCSVTGT